MDTAFINTMGTSPELYYSTVLVCVQESKCVCGEPFITSSVCVRIKRTGVCVGEKVKVTTVDMKTSACDLYVPVHDPCFFEKGFFRVGVGF